MYSRIALLFVFSALLLPLSSQAQVKKAIRKQATKAATKAATQRVEDEIKDQAVEMVTDKVDEAIDQGKQEKAAAKEAKRKADLINRAIGDKETTYTMPAKITFASSITYKVSGGSAGTITHWYSADNSYFGAEKAESSPEKASFVLADLNQNVISTCAIRQRKYVPLTAGYDELFGAALTGASGQKVVARNAQVSDGGKTQTIAGHNAKSIMIDAEGLKASVWVTSDLGASGKNCFELLLSKSSSTASPLLSGAVLGYEVELSDGSKISATATKINEDPNPIMPRGFTSALD